MSRVFVPHRVRIIGVALLSVLALQGCSDHRGMKSLKTVTVSTQTLVRDVYFGADNRLSATESQSLREYLAGLGLGFSDRIWLEDPQAAGADVRRDALVRHLTEFRVLLQEGPAPATDTAPAADGTVRLRIERAIATPPNCPDWSGPNSVNFTAAKHSNYGCAVNSNMAAMVADPRDLVDGRDYKGPGTAETAKAYDAWNRRAPSGYREAGGGGK